MFIPILLMQHAFSAKAEHLPFIALGFAALIVLEWSVYNAMRVMPIHLSGRGSPENPVPKMWMRPFLHSLANRMEDWTSLGQYNWKPDSTS